MKKPLLINRPFKYRYFYVTAIIIAINVLCFIPCVINPQLNKFIQVVFGLNRRLCIESHFLWQPITYMFIHGSWGHIIFNMLALACFGFMVERTIGSWEFLTFYMVCGIFDGIISVLLYWLFGVNTLLIGASGAIYSVLLFFAVLYPRSILRIWGIIPIPAPLLVLLYAVIEILSQVFGSGNVAHLTHLTGFVMAFIYLIVRMRVNPFKVWKDAYGRRR